MKANQACAVFGGRFPHSTAVFPGGSSQGVKLDFIIKYQQLMEEVKEFIVNQYIPDIAAVARAFPEYWNIGASKGGFLSFGLLPKSSDRNADRLFTPGVLFNGTVSPVDYMKITEDVRYAKYSSPSGKNVRQGETVPAPHKKDSYSWTKAPRYDDKVVEVGPSARVLVDY
jgi:ferredoxin hydrogenase large subunit/hydrogenase large subunit